MFSTHEKMLVVFFELTNTHAHMHTHNIRIRALTFLCVLEPFNKGFHLLKENALSFSRMGLAVPLQNRLLVQDISFTKQQKRCKKTQSNRQIIRGQERSSAKTARVIDLCRGELQFSGRPS